MSSQCSKVVVCVFAALALLSPAVFADTGDPVLLNEILASHTGTDNTEFIELYGIPGYSLDGISLIVVESDSYGNGTIDRRIDFSAADQIGANGFFLVGNCNGLDTNYSVIPDMAVGDNYLENSSMTVVLVQTASISGGAVTGSEVVLDDLGLTDGDAGDSFSWPPNLTPPVIGPDGTYFPAGGRRLNDGVDTNSAADWVFADFNLGTANTPTGGGNNGCGAWELTIPEIQGAGHTSPYAGEYVSATGIVTLVLPYGFYLQDTTGDGDDDTSDGILIYTGTTPLVAAGDEVDFEGTVSEYGSDTNLTKTEILPATTTVLSTGNPLPDPAVIGRDGRVPPAEIIDDDNFGTWDPDNDGIDFYETFEHMRVMVNEAVVVAPANYYGEIFVLTDDGIDASGLNARDGITVSDGDYNPERIQLQIDDDILPGFSPQVQTGDTLGDVFGILDYAYGSFELLVTQTFTPVSGGLTGETTTLAGSASQFTVASYNVENLDPNDSDGTDTDVADGKFDELAYDIVNNLQSPHIIALQEVQDNDGTVDSTVVDAFTTAATLISAITAAGGAAYSYYDIAPDDDEDGGQAGGNIRCGYLYNASVVTFVSGERILDTVGDDAFANCRKPLRATFTFAGETVILINCHFTAKSGSDPLFGSVQPPANGGEDRREDQAAEVNAFVDGILAIDPDARIVVLGDMNEYTFLSPMATLAGPEPVITDLAGTIAEAERYSSLYEGNAQALCHILASDSLAGAAEYDPVHLNSEFLDQTASDKDPLVACFAFGFTGTIGCDYTVTPLSGTVPFSTVHRITLSNTLSGGAVLTRRIAGRIDVTIGNGTWFPNWRRGYTNVAPDGTYYTQWQMNFPDLATVIGDNTFALVAMDITPAPFNQPPYPASGDSCTAVNVVTAAAP